MKPLVSQPLSGIPTVRSVVQNIVLTRLPIILCLATAIVLVWWSVSRLSPLLTRYNGVLREAERLTLQVTQLELRRKAALTNRVPNRHESLLRQFFEDQNSLTQWLDDELSRESLTNGYNLQWKFSTPPGTVRVSSNSLPVYRIHIDLSPEPAKPQNQTSFQNLLRILDRIVRDDRWCVLDALDVSSSSEGPLRGGIDIRVLGQPSSP